MDERVPDELSQVTREVYAAREALLEAARRYDEVLSRHMSAWESHRKKFPTSEMPHAVAAGRAAMYENQIEGAREHKEALSPILKLLARNGRQEEELDGGAPPGRAPPGLTRSAAR